MARGTTGKPSRRGHHEGTIFKRDDGKGGVRWVAELSLANGQRRTLYGRTRQEAQQRLAAAKRDIDQGVTLGSDRQTIVQFIASWLQAIEPTVSEATYRRYESSLRVHVLPEIGTVRLHSLSAQHVQQLYARLLASGRSVSTVAHVHRALRGALTSAVKLGLVSRNVASMTQAPREKRAERQVLTAVQARSLLAAARGERLEALYVVALSTGMRIGELLALRWEQVDLDHASLQVVASLSWSGRSRGYVFNEPKTKRSRRRIALALPAVAALRRHRAAQRAEREELGPAWVDMDLVFASTIGGPCEASNVRSRSFHPLLTRAGLPLVGFHSLRHTAATLLLEAGINVKVVSEMLGHSSALQTMDTYQHVLAHMQQDAAAAMSEVLRGDDEATNDAFREGRLRG